MNCKNCKASLNGDEDFCPRCGTPQKFTDTDSNTVPKKDGTTPPTQESAIFHSEPVYIYADAPKEKAAKKPKFTIALVSLFIISVLVVGAVSLAGHLKLTPVFSQLFTTQSTTEAESVTTLTTENTGILGMITPDITLKNQAYTVTYEKGLFLRKGPDNTYAVAGNISYGATLQLIGKNLSNDLWVYVYAPSEDLYGWVMASYITESSLLLQSDLTKVTEENETK